ncbi:zinc transporter ZntB [Defluviimonas sp. WL0024]|uniref:Zinc transporter ZntB n=1 Tax=Albidovulum salinarum TaxID=2984153 RepID=A0ABT2X4H5_9RHOB|nr:CorA family divalent cation transporter [Defluviimonas sp. WL0024]MCU9848644.1 zinc transporter ZntB [Defluviimonas sp. WL0024]
MTQTLAPIAAYDILPDGTARALSDPWPDAEPAPDAIWRWMHFERTDPGFVAWSAEHLPAPVRAALLQAETRPHCDAIGDGLLVTLRGMNLNPGQAEEDMVSLRLWIRANLVVTARLRRVFPMDDLRREIAEGRATASPAAFVARLADLVTERIETASSAREDLLDGIEEALLDDESEALAAHTTEIARLARSVIKLRRHIAPQREALNRLAGIEAAFLTSPSRYALRHAANRTTRAVEELDTVRDRLTALRTHIDSLQTARLGRNGFILSVVAVVFLPLSFLTGLFGMNVAGIPGTVWPWAFATLSLAMMLLGLGLWVILRWRNWF